MSSLNITGILILAACLQVNAGNPARHLISPIHATSFHEVMNEMIANPLEYPPLEITGTVKDENGAPLFNASVTIKGTSKGATTNANGDFNIVVPGSEAVLVISYTGYISQEIQVSNNATMNIILLKANNALNEVVVTALGIKREAKSLGYSTATVDMEQLADHPTNFGNSLQGKVAGVNVSPPASGPGGSSKIRIRGQSSFGGDNSPLIVVNGTPVNNTTSTGQGSSDGGDGL